MFYVKKMTEEDFEFAVRLTDTRGWNLIEDDFKFMTKLEPEGCFVLFEGSERIGLITSIGFDKIGWFGNLIVEEKHRKKGAGALLVKSVINYFSGKGIDNVGLYSYMDAIPFYEKLGFKYDSEFIVLEGKISASPVNNSVREAGKEDFPKIINYDSECFGASRKKLLEAILHSKGNLCYLSTENGHVLGYAMAKAYGGFAEIGPLACQRERSDIAINLLKGVLNRLDGFKVSFCLSKKEIVIVNFLSEMGINEHFYVVRMFLKPFNCKDCIYLAESLERG